MSNMISKRMILNISVESLDGVTRVEPEGGWQNKLLKYHIRVNCTVCRIELLELYNGNLVPLYLSAATWTRGRDGFGYHRPLYCPLCNCHGGLRILRRGGRPITGEGEAMPVMEMQVVGSFRVHQNPKWFYFGWICRKDEDDGSEDVFGTFYVDRKGNYEFKYLVKFDDDDDDEVVLHIKGLKGRLESAEWEEEVEGLWIQESSRLYSGIDYADHDF